MTHQYIDFIEGKVAASSGSKIDRIFNYSDDALEQDHAYIQWLFPLPEPSRFNPDAPLINVAELQEAMVRYPALQATMIQSAAKMNAFWGIEPFDARKLKKLNGHNGLRFSRVLQSLVYHGLKETAQNMLHVVLDAMKTGKVSLQPTLNGKTGMTLWEVGFIHACSVMES